MELLDEFGAEAYLVFFGIIEIYSREFSAENQWKLDVTLSFFHRKLHTSPSKIKKILSKITKWQVEYKDNRVIIFIPKFKELLDNWTVRQIKKDDVLLRSNDVESTQPIRIKKKKKNKEEYKEEQNEIFNLPSQDVIQEASEPKINDEINKVCKKLYDEKIFPEVNAFKNTMIKNKRNVRSILHVLSRCYLTKPETPWAFCTKIIENESPNYNARDYLKAT